MTPSITSPNKRKNKNQQIPKWLQTVLSVAAWLVLWHLASVWVGLELLLASPAAVARQLLTLLPTADFWSSVLFSLSRMTGGFLLAFMVGLLLAVAAYHIPGVAMFLSPLIGTVKAAPAAAYTILCLIILPSHLLAFIVSFLMGLPIIYTNLLQGLQSTDRKLLEMAAVYGMGPLKKAVYIYFSQLMPFLVSACSLALGLCWKSGIAAEVIGLPRGSIGEQFYQAKIFVDTKSVLAWTVVVICISVLFEKGFLYLLRKLQHSLERR